MEAISFSSLLFLLLLFLFLLPLFFPPSILLPKLLSFLPSLHPNPNPGPDPRPATRSLPPTADRTQQLDLRTVFATFDSDRDGFISKQELLSSLRRLGLMATTDEVSSMMDKADANGDGLIDFDEFKEISSLWGLDGDGGREEEGMREAFAVFDGNGDGKITAEELSLVLKSLGLREGERREACRDMIEKVDGDGDGMIDYEEFKKMMVKEGKIF